jgi:hypothetical protein
VTLLASEWPWAEAAATGRFVAALHGWHEFFLLAGTAAVTLVGLLFVALSFHLETLLDPAREHLLSHARQTFRGFLYVLMTSLFLLVPDMTARMTGLWLGAISLVFFVVIVSFDRPRGGVADPSGHDQFMIRRRRQQQLVLLLGAGTAIAILIWRDPDLLMLFAGVTLLQLSSAAWTSWELLVQVGRIRRESGKPVAP